MYLVCNPIQNSVFANLHTLFIHPICIIWDQYIQIEGHLKSTRNVQIFDTRLSYLDIDYFLRCISLTEPRFPQMYVVYSFYLNLPFLMFLLIQDLSLLGWVRSMIKKRYTYSPNKVRQYLHYILLAFRRQLERLSSLIVIGTFQGFYVCLEYLIIFLQRESVVLIVEFFQLLYLFGELLIISKSNKLKVWHLISDEIKALLRKLSLFIIRSTMGKPIIQFGFNLIVIVLSPLLRISVVLLYKGLKFHCFIEEWLIITLKQSWDLLSYIGIPLSRQIVISS